MRAAIATAWKADPVVQVVPDPSPGPGEALVEVVAASCAHFDLSVMTGEFFVVPGLPFIPGAEGAGRILSSSVHPAGTAVRIRGGSVGTTRNGAWADRLIAADDELEVLTPGTDLVLAAGFYSACATAHAALRLVGAFSPGQTVAVTGASGSVGYLTAQLALRLGAGRVVAFHRDPAQAHLIPAGAESAIWNGEATLAPFEGGEGFDLVVDVVGGDVLALLATRATKPGGRVAMVGYAAAEELSLSIPDLLGASVSLAPVSLKRMQGDVPPAAELLAEVERGDVEVRLSKVPLAELPRALDLLRQGTAGGRIVLIP
jgi:NADPH:quinone reductase-like Zn-dependent oxidoreductase